jgi:hypothetical protein
MSARLLSKMARDEEPRNQPATELSIATNISVSALDRRNSKCSRGISSKINPQSHHFRKIVNESLRHATSSEKTEDYPSFWKLSLLSIALCFAAFCVSLMVILLTVYPRCLKPLI